MAVSQVSQLELSRRDTRDLVRVLARNRTGATKACRVDHTITEVLFRRRAIGRVGQMDIFDGNAGARRRGATLQASNDVARCGAGDVPHCDIVDVEERRVALARLPVVAGALRDREGGVEDVLEGVVFDEEARNKT